MKWKALYARLDMVRKQEGISWRKLGKLLGLHSSTFTRMKHGRAVNAQNLLIINRIVPVTEILHAPRKTR